MRRSRRAAISSCCRSPPARSGLPTIAIGEALGGGLAAHDLAGKVVLFGNQASDAKDVFKIPLACAGGVEQQIYGVALHGQIVSQLIGQARGTERPLQSLAQLLRDPAQGQLAEAAWTLLWTLAGGDRRLAPAPAAAGRARRRARRRGAARRHALGLRRAGLVAAGRAAACRPAADARAGHRLRAGARDAQARAA